MNNLVKVIWTGRLYYWVVGLAWVLPLWLVNAKLSAGSGKAVISISWTVYILTVYFSMVRSMTIMRPIMVETKHSGGFLLKSKNGVFSSVGSFIGLVMFVLLRPYNSLSLSWLIAVVCGVITSLMIYGLINWFESELRLARNSEEKIANLQGPILSALIIDWLIISIALPIVIMFLIRS